MNPALLRERVAFHRLDAAADGYGNASSGFAAAPFLRTRGRLQMERGRERLEAGRTESAVAGVLTIRSSIAARTVTAADKAVIDGDDYQITAITNPDRKNAMLEISVVRGVAV